MQIPLRDLRKIFCAQSQAYFEVFFNEDFFNEMFLKYQGGSKRRSMKSK